MCDYLNNILQDQKGSTFVIDSAKCHLTNSVSEQITQLGLNKAIVPPRMTNLLQPADVCWLASIKKQLHTKWNQWFLSDQHEFNLNNNMRSPGYAVCINWLSEIWEQFPENMISDSFKYCGITASASRSLVEYIG